MLAGFITVGGGGGGGLSMGFITAREWGKWACR